jgi:hypothetical protein
MEHWWFTARLRLRSILLGRRVERELDEELQFHLEQSLLPLFFPLILIFKFLLFPNNQKHVV